MSPDVNLTHRLLIVDDSEQITTLLAESLSDLAVVAVAHSGDAALRQAQAFNPHVMLVDIVLPGFSGFEVVDALRRRPGGLEAVVIFVTGLQEPANVRRAMELGAAAVLHKPLDMADVRRLVLDALNRSRT